MFKKEPSETKIQEWRTNYQSNLNLIKDLKSTAKITNAEEKPKRTLNQKLTETIEDVIINGAYLKLDSNTIVKNIEDAVGTNDILKATATQSILSAMKKNGNFTGDILRKVTKKPKPHPLHN